MQLSDTCSIPAPRQAVWDLLIDPASLRQCIPGCKKLKEIKPHHYTAQLEIGIGAITGAYQGEVTLSGLSQPVSFKFSIQGQGKPGHLQGTGEIRLEEKNRSTEVHYSGHVQVGGLIAGVGQRLLLITARKLARQFFENLGKIASST